MSAAIHLDIIAAFERWTQGDAPPRELLTKALPFVSESVEAVRGLRLYHLNEHALLTGATTDDATRQIILVEDGGIQTEVLARRQPRYGDGSWWVPLNTESSTFGLLEVISSSSDSPEAANWLMLIGMYISQALEMRELRTLTRKQAVTSGELTHATNFREIASILAQNLLGPGQFVGINFFDYDENNTPVGFKVIATANRKQAFDSDIVVDEETANDFGPFFKQLFEGNGPLFVADVDSTGAISHRAREWMRKYHITAYCSLPMRSRGRTFGFLSINDTHGTLYLSKFHLTIYQNMADQIGTMVELGQLVQTSDYATQISERQKAVFDELIAGQDFHEMAAIIARHMLPQKGRYLGINEIIYDQDGQAVNWVLRASANRDKSYRWSEDFPIKWSDLSERFKNNLMNNEPFVVQDVNNFGAAEFGSSFHTWMKANNIQAVACVPIFQNIQPLAVLVILSNLPTTFTREEMNAFSALSGQMGALIQVRQLFEQASTARNIVDNLSLANRLVTSAGELPLMAQAIMMTMARNMTAAAISLFDQPLGEGQTPRSRRFVGMSTATEIISTSLDNEMVDIPTETQLASLHAGQPVIIHDLTDPVLSDATRQFLKERGIGWIAWFGLRSVGQLMGILSIYYHTSYTLSREEIDSYVTLADQIGLTIRSRQLFQQSQIAQTMASQLVQVNHLISVAEDYSEMASAIATFVPENIDITGILLFSEPVTFREIPRYIKTEVLAYGNEIIRPGIIDPINADNKATEELLDRLHQGEMILVGDTHSIESGLQATTKYLTEHDIFSFTAVGLRVGVRMVGVLVFGAKTPEVFSGLQLDNLRIIAGQVAVAIENRNLINQTADALSFIAEQYEMSSALFMAHTPLDILTIIYRFADGLFKEAYLGFEENDEKVYLVAHIKEGKGEQAAPDKPLATYSIADLVHGDETIIIPDDRMSMTFLMMTAAQRFVGVVLLQNDQPVDVPLNRMRALRTLIDQVTVTLENRYLLEQTETALKETRTLYEVNQALLSSDDSLGILKVMQQLIAPDAHSLSIATLTYDLMGAKAETYTLDSLITPDKSENVKLPLHTGIGAPAMVNFNNRWARLGKNLDFIQDVEGTDALGAISNPGLLYLKQQGIPVRSAIVIPIFDEDFMRQQINIIFTEPRIFDARTRRLYEAVRDQVNIVLQNQRLLRDMLQSAAKLGNQVRLLQSLNQLASSLSAIDNELDLTDEVATSLVNALRIDHVGITLLNNDGEGSTVVSEYPPKGAVGFVIPRDNPLMVQIRNEHGPILIRDVEGEEGLAPENRALLQGMGIKAMLLLPLLNVHNRYLGAIGIDAYTDVDAFTPDVVEIGRAIASQLAVSLQNIRQLTTTRAQAEQLQKLARLGQAIQSKLDVPSIIQTLLTQFSDLIPVEKIRFLLFEPINRRLAVVASYENGVVIPRNDTIILDNTSVAGEAWARREMVHIPELQARRDLSAITTTGSILAMPFFSRGVALGLIEVAHSDVFIYRETDMLIFQQVVNQIGVAIENAEAYTQSQRLARSKALVNEIGSQLQQQLDLDSVLNVTIQELGRALNARRARIRLGTEREME